MHRETELVKERYARRGIAAVAGRYSMLSPEVWMRVQERQRALIDLLKRHAMRPVGELEVLEIGCGDGANLLELIQLGFDPANLAGNDLLPERVARARHNLPSSIRIDEGDAGGLELPPASLDIVYQSTVFSSLLDDEFQARLAELMWTWIKPGGGILWYDFTFDNPANPDVRGVGISRIRQLFPGGRFDLRRVTLAPPLGRRICSIHPALYTWFNLLPFLRTHVFGWIGKSK